jgi:hypothetical protein
MDLTSNIAEPEKPRRWIRLETVGRFLDLSLMSVAFLVFTVAIATLPEAVHPPGMTLEGIVWGWVVMVVFAWAFAATSKPPRLLMFALGAIVGFAAITAYARTELRYEQPMPQPFWVAVGLLLFGGAAALTPGAVKAIRSKL